MKGGGAGNRSRALEADETPGKQAPEALPSSDAGSKPAGTGDGTPDDVDELRAQLAALQRKIGELESRRVAEPNAEPTPAKVVDFSAEAGPPTRLKIVPETRGAGTRGSNYGFAPSLDIIVQSARDDSAKELAHPVRKPYILRPWHATDSSTS